MMSKKPLEKDRTTLERIIDAGRDEFLRLGFKDASLRNIVKTAGVTTGAFYGYFPDKEALFKAVAGGPAEKLKEYYLGTLKKFSKMSVEQKADQAFSYSRMHLKNFINFIYDNFSSFKLVICYAEGTEYAGYIHSLVEIEVDYTIRFLKAMNESGQANIPIKPDLMHILFSSFFHAVFETVVHDMPKEEAGEYIESLNDFFSAGWKRVWRMENYQKT